MSTDIRLKVAIEVAGQTVAHEDYSNFNLALRLLGSVDSDLDQDGLLRDSITESLDALFVLPRDQLDVDGLISEWWSAGEKEISEFRYRAAGAIEADRAFIVRILNFTSGIDGKEFSKTSELARSILGAGFEPQEGEALMGFKNKPTEEEIDAGARCADYLEQRQLLTMTLPEVFGPRALLFLANDQAQVEVLSSSSAQILRSTLISFQEKNANLRLIELVRVAYDANILNSRQDSVAADAVPLSPEVRRAIFASHIVNRLQDQPPEDLELHDIEISGTSLSDDERRALVKDIDSLSVHDGRWEEALSAFARELRDLYTERASSDLIIDGFQGPMIAESLLGQIDTERIQKTAIEFALQVYDECDFQNLDMAIYMISRLPDQALAGIEPSKRRRLDNLRYLVPLNAESQSDWLLKVRTQRRQEATLDADLRLRVQEARSLVEERIKTEVATGQVAAGIPNDFFDYYSRVARVGLPSQQLGKDEGHHLERLDTPDARSFQMKIRREEAVELGRLYRAMPDNPGMTELKNLVKALHDQQILTAYFLRKRVFGDDNRN